MKKLLALIVLVSIFSGYMIGHFDATQRPPAASSASEAPLLDYVNKVRSDHGVAALREDVGLDGTAKIKAEDMAAQNYMAHTTPGGEPFYTIIQKNRPGLKHVGENLAECFKTTPEMMSAWIKSPGHLENMINADFTLFGSYTVYDQDRSCSLTVNHFGKEF